MHADDTDTTPGASEPDAAPSDPPAAPDAAPSGPAPQPDAPAAPPSLPPDARPEPVAYLKGAKDPPANVRVLLEQTSDTPQHEAGEKPPE
jgi:hypothetical protein